MTANAKPFWKNLQLSIRRKKGTAVTGLTRLDRNRKATLIKSKDSGPLKGDRKLTSTLVNQ